MEEQSGQGSSPETKVFIGDLVFENETDFQKISETIKKAFKNPEAIADVKVNPNRSKMGFSYAFVTFRTAEDGTDECTQPARRWRRRPSPSTGTQSAWRSSRHATTTKYTSGTSAA